MRLRAAIAVVAVTLATAEAADAAATRYASPGGTGPQATCPQNDPCSILDAVEGPAAQNGDTVLLAPGTYALSETLDVTKQLVIQPANPAAARPVITSTSSSIAVDVTTSQALVGLEIRGTNIALHLGGGTYAQLVVVSAGAAACYLEDANPGPANIRLNDSTCLSTGGGQAVAAFAEDPSDSIAANLTNVTAVSPEIGFTQFGIYTQAGGASATIDLIGTNVIASGGNGTFGGDIRAVLNNMATTSAISLDHSNFDIASAAGGGLITMPGTANGNQTSPPQFVNLAGGNLHQVQGSPTINTGTPNAFLLGALDVDGDPRVVGAAPDIGSDEFVPEVIPQLDTVAPDTTLTRTPKEKVKSRKRRKKARFAFTSSEPGSTFSCRLDGNERACDGSFAARVKRGRHGFEVAATDAAGNTDLTPATFNWKLKRKR